MATDNIQLNYLTINQAQKEEVFNDNMNIIDQEVSDLDGRVTLLESGGTGGTSYDDTELRNRITQNEADISALEQTHISMTSDIDALQTLTSEHDTQISSLQTNNTNILNRLSDVEDNDIIQDTDINGLEDRVFVLENAGGSGYDDTELRNRIIKNEDDIVSLNTFYTSLSSRVDTVESVNSTQNTTLNAYDIRITDLENSSSFDPTPIEIRLTDVEEDLSIVKTNQTNIQNDFNSLETNVNTFDSRINSNDTDISGLDTRVTTLENEDNTYDDTELRGRITTNESDIDALQLSDSSQDISISNLDGRVTTLEQSGGSSYDDTELRGRITTNESDIDILQLSDTTQNQDINALEVTTQDHETRITTLESGGGTGGGDMPQTGEIRKFSRAHIPTDWYELKEFSTYNNIEDMYFIASNNIDNNQLNPAQYEIKKTSSLNTFFTDSSGLYRLDKNGFNILNASINANFSGANFSFFHKQGQDTMNILDFNNERLVLIEYSLLNNNFTSTTDFYDKKGANITDNKNFKVIDKNHENIYVIHNTANQELFILKFNLSTKTSTTVFHSDVNFSAGISGWNNFYLGTIYFDSNGDIIMSMNTDNNTKAIKINKTDLTLSDATSSAINNNFQSVKLSSSSSFIEILWIGDNQIIIDNTNNNKINMVKNYDTFFTEDLFNINIANLRQQESLDVWNILFDEDYNLFYYNSSHNRVYCNFKKVDDSYNYKQNEIVNCIYNVIQ